jgi:hypothetical protein
LGTQKQNARDAVERGLYHRGVEAPAAKLTPESVIDIRTRYATGTSAALLGKEYGVMPGTIYSVVHGLSWTHVGGPITPKKRGVLKGENHPRTRLTDLQVVAIREAYAKGRSLNGLAKDYQTNKGSVTNIVSGKTFKDSGGPITRKGVSRGEALPQSKLTEADVRTIKSLAAEGLSQLKIAQRLSVSRSLVGLILSGQRWAHLS